MKTKLGFSLYTVFALSLFAIFSCTKTKVESDSIVGTWVLQYSDSADLHTGYPQDANVVFPNGGGYSNWASRLTLMSNDSATWINCGFDLMPELQSSGTYSIESDSSKQNQITFNFLYKLGTWGPGRYTTYAYTLVNANTLKLKTPENNPTVFTYKRK